VPGYRPAAAAAVHPEPDRLLARLRQPDRLGSGQPALGRWLRHPPL